MNTARLFPAPIVTRRSYRSLPAWRAACVALVVGLPAAGITADHDIDRTTLASRVLWTAAYLLIAAVSIWVGRRQPLGPWEDR